MALHIEFGQFDTDGETLYNKNNSGELDGDNISRTPGVRVDEVGGMRTKDNSAKGSNSSFTNVHALLDKRRAKHEQGSETAKNDVHQVRLGNIKVVPSHFG